MAAAATASCVVNPRMGHELDCIDVKDASSGQPKTVIVVGGGLAGMEAARMTAFSGHHLTLFERDVRLGGQMLLAREMPDRREIGDILFWYERQLDSLGGQIRLSTEVDAERNLSWIWESRASGHLCSGQAKA